MAELTPKDLKTLSLALSYAVVERDSYADATRNMGKDDPYHKRALKLASDFEKLHQKIFGKPTAHRQQMDQFAQMDSVSIHKIKGRQDD